MWDIELDEDFATWLGDLDAAIRGEILGHVGVLRQHGPHLGRPHVDTIGGSRHSNMKELRIQIGGDPWRVLFAFDPRRHAVLLVGGHKGGDKRWYKTHVPIADARFDRHLARLRLPG